MLNPLHLRAACEECEEQTNKLYLPKRFFLKCFRDFAILFMAAAFFSYQIFAIFTCIVWIVGAIDLFLFAKIWHLHQLSVGRLIVFLILLLFLSCGTGVLIRQILLYYFA